MNRLQALRVFIASFALLALTSCSTGINAGRQGGVAFIAMSVMLILMVAILWFILGREE